jgi:hypothetical protein
LAGLTCKLNPACGAVISHSASLMSLSSLSEWIGML